ncbi:MAG: hypothetical protein C0392_00250 [Syntrophus sp. (in: bacteria)]|nr:hypothetical protein [Syntrophus sp. (in: bacteria)]
MKEKTSDVTPTRGKGALESMLAGLRAKLADRLIEPGHRTGRILDIGCGPQPYFLLNIAFSEKHGLDQAIMEADQQRFLDKGVHLKKYNVEETRKLPFPDQYFDVVTMLAVFEHITPVFLPQVIKEIKRVLRPGGLYILTTPAAWTDVLLRTLAQLRLVSSTEIDDHKDTYAPAKIIALLEKGGFSREKIDCGFFEAFMNIWAKAEKH